METQENRDEQGQAEGGEGSASPEEFAEGVENDPSTASSGDDDELEQVRGG